MSDGKSASALDRLFATIEARKGADPTASYTARLLAGGTRAITAKVSEEAAETVAAALGEGPCGRNWRAAKGYRGWRKRPRAKRPPTRSERHVLRPGQYFRQDPAR